MKEKLYVTIRDDDDSEVELLEYINVEFTLKNGVYSCDDLVSIKPRRRVYLSSDFKHVYFTYFNDVIYYQVEAISSKPPKKSKARSLANFRKRYLREIRYSQEQYEMMKKWVMEGEK